MWTTIIWEFNDNWISEDNLAESGEGRSDLFISDIATACQMVSPSESSLNISSLWIRHEKLTRLVLVYKQFISKQKHMASRVDEVEAGVNVGMEQGTCENHAR